MKLNDPDIKTLLLIALGLAFLSMPDPTLSTIGIVLLTIQAVNQIDQQ